MIKYSEEKLLQEGYTLTNMKIESVDLSMEDHGCITLQMGISGCSRGCVYGGYCLGRGYVGASEYDSGPNSMEYIMRIMDTVGVSRFNNMKGKYIRIAMKNWFDPVKIIGHITDDKWFDPESFFKDYGE